MTEYNLDLCTWFTERQLPHTPPHFVLSTTELPANGLEWIYNHCKGRFSVVDVFDEDTLFGSNKLVPAFEDPAEAVFYELHWS